LPVSPARRFAPVEADDAGWIILPGPPVAKRAPTNGTVGPMSGGRIPRALSRATPFLRKGVDFASAFRRKGD
jgi:hypothetical protein